MKLPIANGIILSFALSLTTAFAQEATATSQTPVHVSGGVMTGRIMTRTAVVVSPDSHAHGIVVLHAIIGRDGRVKELSVISGPPMLLSACIDAIKQWTYKPYLLNGQPVDVETTVTLIID